MTELIVEGGAAMRVQTAAQPAPGDILVTKVASHYHIGWVEAAGRPVAAIGVRHDEDEALALACSLRRPGRRVFLDAMACSNDHVEIDCADHHDEDWG